jgi:hypothetical protein
LAHYFYQPKNENGINGRIIMGEDGIRKARRYFFGFFFFLSAEVILNLCYVGRLRHLFTSIPDDVMVLLFGIYWILAIAFAAGLLSCLYQSRRIRKEIGRTRWTL